MKYLDSDKLLSLIKGMQEEGATFAIVTVLANGGRSHKLVVTERDTKTPGVNGLEEAEGLDNELASAVAELAKRAISSGRPTNLLEISTGEERHVVAIEVIRPKPSVIVFGAGHVGQAVALMANMVGYCVTVVDDREAFANRQRLPDPAIEIIAESFDRAAKSVTITSNTAIVIVTRGHQYDELCLRSVIESGARYIGMIGSRRRVISVFRQLTESGVAQKQLDRVHAPIGLRIGAKSPQEIAVAILAEIIQTFNAQVADSPSSN